MKLIKLNAVHNDIICTVFPETLDHSPVCPSVETESADADNTAYQQYAIVCKSLRDNVSVPSTDIVIKLFECSAVTCCRSFVHTLAITENERFTVAVPSGQTRRMELSCDKTGKASHSSGVTKACRSYVGRRG